jgi:hypothetical protein
VSADFAQCFVGQGNEAQNLEFLLEGTAGAFAVVESGGQAITQSPPLLCLKSKFLLLKR